MNPDVIVVFKGSPMEFAALVGILSFAIGVVFGSWLATPSKKEVKSDEAK